MTVKSCETALRLLTNPKQKDADKSSLRTVLEGLINPDKVPNRKKCKGSETHPSDKYCSKTWKYDTKWRLRGKQLFTTILPPCAAAGGRTPYILFKSLKTIRPVFLSLFLWHTCIANANQRSGVLSNEKMLRAQTNPLDKMLHKIVRSHRCQIPFEFR